MTRPKKYLLMSLALMGASSLQASAPYEHVMQDSSALTGIVMPVQTPLVTVVHDGGAVSQLLGAVTGDGKKAFDQLPTIVNPSHLALDSIHIAKPMKIAQIVGGQGGFDPKNYGISIYLKLFNFQIASGGGFVKEEKSPKRGFFAEMHRVVTGRDVKPGSTSDAFHLLVTGRPAIREGK
ncbi:hypothetical protein OAN22_00430 [Alphaproteobacteria bacterium]|nr:hypothetical protein [Alphaproteobacteria bacterium]